jgi:hypothetical protein
MRFRGNHGVTLVSWTSVSVRRPWLASDQFIPVPWAIRASALITGDGKLLPCPLPGSGSRDSSPHVGTSRPGGELLR